MIVRKLNEGQSNDKDWVADTWTGEAVATLGEAVYEMVIEELMSGLTGDG